MGLLDRRATLIAAALIAAIVAPPAPSHAQTAAWPQRPVKFIVPFGPGAGADIGARLIQERLTARWGKPVVIENRPGGDSFIAIQAVLSANDDHTFLWGPSGNFIVHPYHYQKLPYNPDDILPIARFSATILSVGVPASLSIVDLADFVKRARAEAGKCNSAAVPGITELAFDYFAKKAGLTFTKVPYRDIVQAVNDLAEGRLQVYTSSYAIQRPQQQGRPDQGPGADGQQARAEPPRHSDRDRGGLPDAGNGRPGRPVRQPRPSPPSCARRSAPTSSRWPTTRRSTPSSTPPRRRPTRGGAKEFTEIMRRQRAHIATIAKALDLTPTR